MSKYQPSGPSHPCPICNRGEAGAEKKGGDCRILEFSNVVLCHTYIDQTPDTNGYHYLRKTTKGAEWGVWVWAKKDEKSGKISGNKERPKLEQRQYFEYPDRDGNPLIRVVRQKGNDIEFYQEYWIENQWLSASKVNDELRTSMRKAIPIYRYHEVRAAIDRNDPVFFVEGETAADALWEFGIAATTSIGGSKAYRHWGDYKADLDGADLILCPDRDKAGVAYIDEVAKDFPKHRLYKVFRNSPIWEFLPDAGGLDVVDELKSGVKPKQILEGIVKPEPEKTAPEKKPLPSYDEALDQVDYLEQEFITESELEWAILSYVKESGLSTLGIKSDRLLRMARARRDGTEELEVVDARDILDGQDSCRKWVVPGLIPLGSVVCFAASGGTGKSSFSYNISKHVALGTPWSGYPVMQGKVLVIQADEPTVDIRDKLDIANYFEVPRGLVRFITKWRFSQIRQLEALIKHDQPVLVIIDSYTAAHAGMNTELSKSSAGDSLYQLRDIANNLNCSFVVIHHLNKVDDLRDSSTIKDNVSEVWTMTHNEKDCPNRDHLVLEISKSRAGIAGRYLLKRNPIDYSWEHLGSVDGSEVFIQKVLNALKEVAPRTFAPKQLSERVGISYQQAEATLEQCRRMGFIKSQWSQFTRSDGTQSRFRVYFYDNDQPIQTEAEQPIETPVSATVDDYEYEDF